jgi:hypothetical protein
MEKFKEALLNIIKFGGRLLLFVTILVVVIFGYLLKNEQAADGSLVRYDTTFCIAARFHNFDMVVQFRGFHIVVGFFLFNPLCV